MGTTSENRVSQRYTIENSKICFVDFEGLGKCCLHNLSYGGFGIDTADLPSDFSKEALNQKYNIKLGLFGEQTTGQAMMVFRSDKSTGFAFVHENADMLIYLSRVLDRMRVGSTLEMVPANLRKDVYRGEEWMCLHGDGPTDLRIQNEGAKIKEAILSFRSGEDYFDLLFKGNHIEMRRNVDTTGVAARMTTDRNLDAGTVRQALSILIGLNQTEAVEQSEKLLNIALESMPSLHF